MSIASELENLRRALDEVDVLSDITRTTFGDTDWKKPDPGTVEVMTTLIRLIDKSSFSAMQVFHRLRRAVAEAGERRDRAAPSPSAGKQAPVGQAAPSGRAAPSAPPPSAPPPSAPAASARETMSARDADIVLRIRYLCPDYRYDGGSDAELLELFKHNRRVLERSDEDVIAAMIARAGAYTLPSGE
ncbi:MAG TPA: hypothetical protein VFU97_15810 [Xanthobacteraceae bacterium]|nr:hypothetical protein [Xanthobacteraceae bacterium]